MYLSSVRIKRFRNFADLEVSFREGLNLIVGENNIGKSNLVDAIRIALGWGAFERASLRAQKTDLHRDALGETAASFEIALEFSGLSKIDMATFLECLVYNTTEPSKSLVRIGYRWSWDDTTNRYAEERWGGDHVEHSVKAEVLQALPSTYLEPLRDALAYLSSGRGSRIYALLQRMSSEGDRKSLVEIMAAATEQLRAQPLIDRANDAIMKNLRDTVGEGLTPKIGLAPSAPTFDSVAQSIRATLRVPGVSEAASADSLVDAEISENGMGYNNLLYIATILAHRATAQDGDVPLVFIEEPEAHLHPQLQLLLADYLLEEASAMNRDEEKGGAEDSPSQASNKVADQENQAEDSPTKVQGPSRQVFLTTHSPTLASHVSPDRLVVLHRSASSTKRLKAASLWQCGLAEDELHRLRRLLDVTKATLFFARGLILVEGISEQILVPVLAKRLGVELDKLGVSVVALHGLSFETVLRLFNAQGIELPVVILTDSDPEVKVHETPILPNIKGVCWHEAPVLEGESASLRKIRLQVEGHDELKLEIATVTFEYDLALGGNGTNADAMVAVWPTASGTNPQILTPGNLALLTTANNKARFVWQGVCRKDAGKHKAALAQALASHLASDATIDFQAPPYIERAVRFLECKLSQDLQYDHTSATH